MMREKTAKSIRIWHFSWSSFSYKFCSAWFLVFSQVEQRVGRTPHLRGDRFCRRPQRWIFATVLLHQAHRTLADFWGKFVRWDLVHGSILSRGGASSKPGAIHFASSLL